MRAMQLFFTNYGWLLLLDAVLFVLFGDLVAKAITLQVQTHTTPNLTFVLISLIQSLVWFITASAVFLFIRKNDLSEPKAYFKVYFFKYIQFLLFSSFIIMLGLYLLIIAGITKFPAMPWIISASIKTLEYCSLFYWLNSPGRFINLAISFERALNMILYNLPFILFLIGIIWSVDLGLCLLANKILNTNIRHLVFLQATQLLVQDSTSLLITIKALAIKYASFVVEYFWISILFVFYRHVYDEKYTKSIFEQEQ
jgi:hypothetical protein